MTYIHTIPEGEATGRLRELYEADREKLGYVPNYTQAMSLRPEVIDAWGHLLSTIRSPMDLRRYELVTIAVASKLRCSY